MASAQKTANIKETKGGLMRDLAKLGYYPVVDACTELYRGNNNSMDTVVRQMEPDGKLNTKSNHNVVILEKAGCLEVVMTNPEESRAAAQLGADKIVVRFRYTGGKDSETFISNVVRAVVELSELKLEASYRIALHNHLSEMGGEILNCVTNMMDDGRASGWAFLANLILFNIDIAVVTCHNHFPEEGWRKLADEAWKYGIRLVPGFEATLPLSEFVTCSLPSCDKFPTPNGPHVLLLFESPELATVFWNEYFSKRLYEYAPCASLYVTLYKIFDIIDNDERFRGKVERLIAHPVCDVGLPDVGIVNRLAKGEISVAQMIAILRRAQGIGHFNAAVGTTPLDFKAYIEDVKRCSHFSATEKDLRIANIIGAELFIRDLLIRQALGRMLSPNNINIAIAKEFTSPKDGPIGFMDTDGHHFPNPFDKVLWGNPELGPLGAGHNWIRFKGLPAARPDAKWMIEFMYGMHRDEIEDAKPKVYASYTKDGISIVDPSRTAVPFPQKILNLAESAYYYVTQQGEVLASDYFKNLIKKGKITDIACGSIPPENIFHV